MGVQTQTGADTVQLVAAISSEKEHFNKSYVYHRPTAAVLGAAHIVMGIVILVVGECKHWWFRTEAYYFEDEDISCPEADDREEDHKAEPRICKGTSSIYFGPVLFAITGVTQIVTRWYPGSFTVGCLVMQSYFCAFVVMCMLTMVRELWWVALTELPVALVTLVLSCKAICCIKEQSEKKSFFAEAPSQKV